MNDRYRGPLGWLRRWNYRRVERRRWNRDAVEALIEDDGAIMEGLLRLLDQARSEGASRAAGQALLERRLEEISTELGARTGALDQALGDQAVRLKALDQALGDQGARLKALDQALGDQGARLGVLDQALAGLAATLEPRLQAPAAPATVDTFPVVATARGGLLEPELQVLAHLAPALSPRLAIDVGAHHGVFSGVLLDLGFTVHALEPNPEARAELVRRLDGRAGLTIHPVAAGAAEGEAELGLVADPSGRYTDPTQFASLAGLPLPEGLVRAGSLRVQVRRLDTLLRDRGLPTPSVVKVDAEGFDLEVLRGLGDVRPEVLLVEFWDEALPFSAPGARNRLPDLVAHARAHGAPWHLVIFRRWGDDRPAFYANWAAAPERSWGNVIFFTSREHFERARQHLGTLVPEARFVAAPRA